MVDAGTPQLERCRIIPLGVSAGRVRWLGVLSDDDAKAARRIVLTLREDRHTVVTAEAEPAVARAEPRRLMPRSELFPFEDARLFGSGERAHVEQKPTHVTLNCSSGNEPAGVVFALGRPSYGASLAVELAGEGGAGFRAQVTAQGETATRAGVPFIGPADRRIVSLPVPAADNVALVLSCPAGEGRFRLTRAVVASRGVADFGRPAAWVWSIPRWRDQGDELLATARGLGIGTLYISVPIEGGKVTEPGRLADFVTRAASAGIAIVAVEGDPDMAYGEGRAEALARARALAAYQAGAPSVSRLAGVQYDIEPYLLSGFTVDPTAVWRAWAESISQLAEALGDRIDAVVPYWVMASPGGREAMMAARPALRQATIMTYRTAPRAIVGAAEPVLAWASANALPVSVALESGPLPPERRDTFLPAQAGQLRVISLGPVAAIVLFDDVREQTPGRAFRFSHSTRVDLTRVSFFGDGASLLQATAAITPDLAAWPATRGLAFHGVAALDPTATRDAASYYGEAQ